MPTYVLKAQQNDDLYVGWSTVVDNLVWIAKGRAAAMQERDVDAERLDRADQYGTSCMELLPGWRDGAFDDRGFVVTNMYHREEPFVWLNRADLGEYARRYLADDVAGAEALCESIPDEDEQP